MKNILYVVGSLVAAIIFFNIFKPVTISGSAMEPNYRNGSNYLQNNLAYKFSNPKRGDVVVFKFTNKPNYKGLFRIIGLPSEKIRIEYGDVYINNNKLDEPYLAKQNSTFPIDPMVIEDVGDGVGRQVKTNAAKFFEEGVDKQIPENNYILMGDNREQSADSRAYGFVAKEDLLGKLILRYK